MLDEDTIEETQDCIQYLLTHYTLRKLSKMLGYKNGHAYISKVMHGEKRPSASLYRRVRANTDILLAAENARREQLKARYNPEYRPPQPEYDDNRQHDTPYDHMNEFMTKLGQDMQQLRERREMQTPAQYNTTSTFFPAQPVLEPLPERCEQCGTKRKLTRYRFLDGHIASICEPCITKYRQHHHI